MRIIPTSALSNSTRQIAAFRSCQSIWRASQTLLAHNEVNISKHNTLYIIKAISVGSALCNLLKT